MWDPKRRTTKAHAATSGGALLDGVGPWTATGTDGSQVTLWADPAPLVAGPVEGDWWFGAGGRREGVGTRWGWSCGVGEGACAYPERVSCGSRLVRVVEPSQRVVGRRRRVA